MQEAQERGELNGEITADELAGILMEGYEGAVMQSKIERSGKALEWFEKVVLPRLLQ